MSTKKSEAAAALAKARAKVTHAGTAEGDRQEGGEGAMGEGDAVGKKTRKSAAKVIPLTKRRRKVIDLVKFIDAHGGKKLDAFRGYGVGPPSTSPPPTPPPPEPRLMTPAQRQASARKAARAQGQGRQGRQCR